MDRNDATTVLPIGVVVVLAVSSEDASDLSRNLQTIDHHQHNIYVKLPSKCAVTDFIPFTDEEAMKYVNCYNIKFDFINELKPFTGNNPLLISQACKCTSLIEVKKKVFVVV